MTLILPVVHLNGTSKTELLDLRENAYSAISEALDALRKMAPNGRDYYPIPGRMDLALEQHTRRMKVLSDLLQEIQDECIEITAL